MTRRRRICVVTGSRADYGLLYWVMKDLDADRDVELQVMATGAHLSPEFGLTIGEIRKDGFTVDQDVETLLSSDSPVGVAKSIGLGVIGFCEAFQRLGPDIVVLLGDRFEIFAAAQAAFVAGIPIAHIAGGDITEGAMDDAMRHSITKLSHLHFVTNAAAAETVRQLGENPDLIFNVGSPGIDYIKRTRLLSREELERVLDLRLRERNLLVTFHPVTLGKQPSTLQFRALLQALDALRGDIGLIFTMPNADPCGRALGYMVEDYVRTHSHARAFTSLGQQHYLSLIAQVDAVVGNSSSGLYEVPSFKKPTVNIGDRQMGRLKASSVIGCGAEPEEIRASIELALVKDCSDVINPYGDGESSKRIVFELKRVEDLQALLKKRFFLRPTQGT